jgi:peptidoglycan/LPS O-acetylase OafA/YrhL
LNALDTSVVREAGRPARPSIDSLTGFRFVAAMMVFVSHYPVPGVGGAALNITKAGYAGVTFFFVLSGFIITYNYLDSFENGSANLRDYFIARFARIYPLYLFFILYCWLLAPEDSRMWLYLLALQAWHPDIKVVFGVNGPAWSIGVEVFLYICFPLLVPLLGRLGLFSSRERLIGGAVLTSMAMLCIGLWFVATGRSGLPPFDPSSAHRWLYRLPASRLGDFLLGMFGAVYFMRFAAKDIASVRRWGMVTNCAALAILAMMAMKINFFSVFSWDVGYALPGALLIVGLAMQPSTVLSRVLAMPVTILLGEASYALYLVHSVPARALRGSTTGDLMHDVAVYVLFVVMVIALSIGLHIGLERPARLGIRRLLTRRRVIKSADGLSSGKS